MSLRRDLARRSAKAWGGRLALAAGAVLVGYYSVTFSIAQAVVGSNPELAYRLAPYDGRITAAYATSLAGEDALPSDRARADVLARRALQQDPTAVAAAATLGLNADLGGDSATARRYFAYAHRLSRRDLRTQLWMIEDAVNRGDLDATVGHYDATLRVFPELGEYLYPIMDEANTEPVIQRAFIKTLATKPLWGEGFINFIALKSTDPKAAADLFTGLERAGVALPETARVHLVSALLTAGQFDTAWSYYSTIRPSVDRRRSRDPEFAATTETPSPLDWTPVNDGSGPTTSMHGGIFDFAAPASIGGPILQQVQLLPPGTYRLSGHSIGIDQATGARPYWTLTCQGGRELGRVEVPNSTTANGNFTGTFTVPVDCPTQTLVLIVRPSDAVSGLSGQFDRVELAPTR